MHNIKQIKKYFDQAFNMEGDIILSDDPEIEDDSIEYGGFCIQICAFDHSLGFSMPCDSDDSMIMYYAEKPDQVLAELKKHIQQ